MQHAELLAEIRSLESKLAERDAEVGKLREAGEALLKQAQLYAISAWSLTEDIQQRNKILKQFSDDAAAFRATLTPEQPAKGGKD